MLQKSGHLHVLTLIVKFIDWGVLCIGQVLFCQANHACFENVRERGLLFLSLFILAKKNYLQLKLLCKQF
jgi:hypothetical protein